MAESAGPLFRDEAQKRGIRFRHSNGASGRLYFFETTPAGCAFLDYDSDGDQDVFLVQSGASDPVRPTGSGSSCALLENEGESFVDVTRETGVAQDMGYGHGVVAGDYDNDGDPDLFLTSYGKLRLLRNDRDRGRFTDVTRDAGLERPHSSAYATSAALGDINLDGRLDLYVCYYGPWTWQTQKHCRDSLGRPDYCSPELYQPAVHRLFRNEGRRFTEITVPAGIARKQGRGLAVAFLDYDEDGDQDILVANDQSPHMLWRNEGNETFTEVAADLGCAFSKGGQLMAGMGIAVGDYDHSGHESFYITNFSGLPNTLFRNLGRSRFDDVTEEAGLARPHLRYLAFGCEFLDYDADGWLDLFVANGHVLLHPDLSGGGLTYRERKQLFHNRGDRTFREITRRAQLGDLAAPRVSRGLAVADFDNDGRLDVLVNNQNDPPQLFHNRTAGGNHWVSFLPEGTRSNRDGLHTRFRVRANGMTQTGTARAGSSYLSCSDRRVYFGLGRATRIEEVEITWPGGRKDVHRALAADRFYRVREDGSATVTSGR